MLASNLLYGLARSRFVDPTAQEQQGDWGKWFKQRFVGDCFMRKTSAVRAVEPIERAHQPVASTHWRTAELPPRSYRNRLLDAFPPDDLRRWDGLLELV